jgi:hypothetical protein
MRTVNNRLRRNYRILVELNSAGKAKTTKTTLMGKGFDFEYFTQIRHGRTGNAYYFLYDLGYRRLGNDRYLLVKKTT